MSSSQMVSVSYIPGYILPFILLSWSPYLWIKEKRTEAHSQILKSLLNMSHLRLWKIKGEIINRFFFSFRCNHSLLLGYKSFIFEIKVIVVIAVYKKQTAELTLSGESIFKEWIYSITLELLQLQGAYRIYIITCKKWCWNRIKDFPTSDFIGCEGMFLCTFKNITQIRLEK